MLINRAGVTTETSQLFLRSEEKLSENVYHLLQNSHFTRFVMFIGFLMKRINFYDLGNN